MKKRIIITLLSICCLSANAYDSYYITPNVNPAFRFDVYYPGEIAIVQGEPKSSTFTIPQDYITPLLLSAQNWGKRLGLNPVTPAIYSYTSINDYNADALSQSVKIVRPPIAEIFDDDYKVTRTSAIFNNWTITTPQEELDAFGSDGLVEIGLGINKEMPGWQPYSGLHPLYHGELPDLYPVMMHEMMHSLGLASAAAGYQKEEGGTTYYFFSEDDTEPISVLDSQLRIYKGATNPLDDPINEIKPMRGPAEGASQAEIEERAIGQGMGFDVETYSPYFIGKNSIKVLGGSDDYDTARNNIINNGTKGGLVNYSFYYPENERERPIVYGLPIHPTDGIDPNTGDLDYDLSHIELRNSYMSHQEFRNWLVPMEAELAFMNDIGYNIPLKKYFGKSYYLDSQVDVYEDGFSEWDNGYTGVSSTIDQAVGIHIYGDNNNITQATRDILMSGEGSIGVRIDGVENTFSLAPNTNIIANGKENLGIAVTWGSEHVVSVGNGASVVADGEDGIAASFDFGSNLFGTLASDIKGSYINYDFSSKENIVPDVENQEALVSIFNVNGTLEGSKAAIYISDNAHVENININNGAHIEGDIISEWNSIISANRAMVMRPNGIGGWREVDPSDPDDIYYTNLNFNAPAGVTVNGDIIGNEIYNTLKMDNAAASVINFDGEEISVNSLNNEGEIRLSKETDIGVTSGEITGDGEINVLNGAGLGFSNNITNIENSLSFNNTSFNTLNNTIDETHMAEVEFNGQNNIAIDVNLQTMTSDKMIFNNQNDLTVNPGTSFQINEVKLMNSNLAFTDSKYYIPFVSEDYNNQNLLGNIAFNGQQNLLTPIFKYNFGYEEDATRSGFTLARGALKKYSSYNPAVVASPVAAQFGGYLSQLNSYEHAFQNMDMKMLMTREERQALKMANLYASTVTPTRFSPTYLPEKDKGGWFRPYTSFEKVNLHNGPHVESISYGSYFGGDSPVYETKNGWDYQYSIYAGYNGSHLNYSGNSVYQNGGTLGATAIWYKDNFFTALTANAGAGVADAHTMYGSEDITMLMTGIASKTGYNWELARGKIIIQPSFLMSYSFVNTFDYTNAAGVKIKSDPLNAINIAPGLKFIGNLKNGWQPYIGMQMVWNIMDKTHFKANDVALPNMSVKPYFQYGVGIQKRWGDRFTGFFQAMVRNGGRNGVALSLGFRWALGK